MNIKKISPNTFEIALDYKELVFNVWDLFTILGYSDGASPAHLNETIEQVLAEVPSLCRIRGGYSLYTNVEWHNAKSVRLHHVELALGHIVSRQLAHAEAIAVVICTIGAGLEAWVQTLMSAGDYFKGYIADAVASLTVDLAMEKMQAHVEQEQLSKGNKISNLFSPGYCDWHVSQQQQLFALLPMHFCGVSLTESSLMLPIKSISGIIGLGTDMRKVDSTCRFCDKINCNYRRRLENYLQET
ncbi:hypothetical protein JXA70_03475 [candidate division KSB1 bacterium]|nr:hypothetical protein [candidate division KSB1 bacterium]